MPAGKRAAASVCREWLSSSREGDERAELEEELRDTRGELVAAGPEVGRGNV